MKERISRLLMLLLSWKEARSVVVAANRTRLDCHAGGGGEGKETLDTSRVSWRVRDLKSKVIINSNRD